WHRYAGDEARAGPTTRVSPARFPTCDAGSGGRAGVPASPSGYISVSLGRSSSSAGRGALGGFAQHVGFAKFVTKGPAVPLAFYGIYAGGDHAGGAIAAKRHAVDTSRRRGGRTCRGGCGRCRRRGARCGARQAFENERVPVPSRADTSRGGGVCGEP